MAEWVCRQSGDCCRSAGGVRMTPGEWKAVQAARPDVAVIARNVPQSGGAVEILSPVGGDACPFYADGCTVYPVRPGVCRAYGCFRKSASDPFLGTDGMIARFQESAGVRRQADAMMIEADAWTLAQEGT